MMKRRGLLATGAVALAMPHVARAQGSRVLRFIPQADLAILDPTITTATVTRNHAFMVFDTLYGLDAAGEPVPEMVAGHEVGDDGRRWTLVLRDGLRFHDGAPVLASDCVASLRRWGRRDPFGKTLLAATEELSAPDDRTILFRLKAPFPLLPLALAKTVPGAPVMMPARVIPAELGTAVTEMVGSGPFRFLLSERVPGARVAYERFAGYVPRPGGAPGLSAGPKVAMLDRVEWQVVPDAATALAAIRRGEVDWWERPIPDLLPVARADKALAVEITNTAGTVAFLQFNHLHPPFDNVAVRRLVQSAVNQADLAEAIGGSDPALRGGKVGIFLPGGPMASEEGLGAMAGRTDFDALKRELQAAGYKGGWSLFVVSADGDFFRDPTVAPAIRANGRDAWIGWPTSLRLEELYQAWFQAPDQAARRSIAHGMQAQTLQDVPYVMLAQVFLPTVVRREVSGVLPGFPKFWNVRKA